MARTHAVSWALNGGGWITRCGCYADTPERLSEDPTCPECRCWIGLCDCVEYHDWSADQDRAT